MTNKFENKSYGISVSFIESTDDNKNNPSESKTEESNDKNICPCCGRKSLYVYKLPDYLFNYECDDCLFKMEIPEEYADCIIATNVRTLHKRTPHYE